MATVLAINNVVRLTIVTRDDEQVAMMTPHAVVTGVGGAPATDQDVADYMDAGLEVLLKPLMAADAEYRGLIVQKIYPAPKAAFVDSNGFAGIGTAGAVSLPRQSAGLISLRTALAGPANRGRMYVPFPSVTDNATDGVPTAGYVTKLNSFASNLIAGLATVNVGGRTAALQLVIWHRTLNNWTPVTTYQSSALWATQRRRGSYGRANTTSL